MGEKPIMRSSPSSLTYRTCPSDQLAQTHIQRRRFRHPVAGLGGSAVSERLGVPGGQYLLFFAAGEAEWRGAGYGLDLAA